MTDDDDATHLERRGRHVREFWFECLPERERDAIVKPHFDAANPTHEDKREATRRFEECDY